MATATRYTGLQPAPSTPTTTSRLHSSRREWDVVSAFSELTTEAITATRLEDLLCLVGEQLCHLLGVTRCSVYLRQDDGRFRGAAGHCQRDGDITAAVKLQEAGIGGDEFSREVIASRSPVLINDVANDARPHRPTMEHWQVSAMLGVPLVFDERVIGIIFVDNLQTIHDYSDEDVTLTEVFGRLAALFIHQAMVNSQLKDKVAEVVRQKNTLEYLSNVHSKLTGAVLQGAEIGALVTLLSELAGKPVVLYDEGFHVLAWSAPPAMKMTQPPVLDPRVRTVPDVRRALTGLTAHAPSAIMPATLKIGLGRRNLVCRLIIEGAPSGYLSIVEVGHKLSDLDAKLAERGVAVLSLQLLSERRQVEAEGQARSDYLSELLRGSREEAQLVRRGLQFGVDLNQGNVLVRISFTNSQDQLGASASRLLLMRQFAAVLGGGEHLALSLPGAVVILVRLREHGPASDPGGVRTLVEQVVTRVAPDLHVRSAVISAVCHKAADFQTSHVELREVNELARAFGWTKGVVTVEELGLLRVVISSGRVKEAVRFAQELVRPLREHDTKDGQLLNTWRTFITAEGKVQPTSRLLGVHENTVRYRLGKIKKITHQDPLSLDSMLAARMAFQVLDLADA